MTRDLLAALGRLLVLLSIALLIAIQFVPYRVSNPAVVEGPQWDSPATEALARRACFDCHSNEVNVPWYGRVAPLAWLVRDHVDEGRSQLNFSEMHLRQEEAHEAGEEVAEGHMPPQYYLLLHPDARLGNAERRALQVGLDATFGDDDGDRLAHGEDHDD